MTWKQDVSTFLEDVSSICTMVMDSIAWTKLVDIFRNSSTVMLCSLPKIKAIRLVIFCNDVIWWRWWLWWNSSVMFWKSVHFLLSINVLSLVELRAILEKMIGWNFSSQKWWIAQRFTGKNKEGGACTVIVKLFTLFSGVIPLCGDPRSKCTCSPRQIINELSRLH